MTPTSWGTKRFQYSKGQNKIVSLLIKNKTKLQYYIWNTVNSVFMHYAVFIVMCVPCPSKDSWKHLQFCSWICASLRWSMTFVRQTQALMTLTSVIYYLVALITTSQGDFPFTNFSIRTVSASHFNCPSYLPAAFLSVLHLVLYSKC